MLLEHLELGQTKLIDPAPQNELFFVAAFCQVLTSLFSLGFDVLCDTFLGREASLGALE